MMEPNHEPDAASRQTDAVSTAEPSGELGTRAVRGAAVTMAAQGSKIVIQVLSTVILARLLSPADYGLIAMIMAVIGVADIFRDFGLSTAAIQAPTLSRDEQHNLFWLNTVLGVVLAVVVIAGAPLLSALYNEPQLAPVARVLAVIFVINGMITQYRADLVRRLEFKRIALADILGPLCGLGVAAGMALGGFGYWALVGQQLTQLLVVFVLLVVGAHWLPRWWHRGVPMRRFVTFGGHLVGSQLVTYAGNNIDTLMLGLRTTPSMLGLYSRSYQLLMQPLGQIRGPITTVAIPVLSKVQDDERRFHDYVAKGQMALGYSLVAAMGFVAGMARPIVEVFLGSQWLEAVDVLRWLAVAAGFTTLAYVGYWVYVTKGLVKQLFHYSFIETGIRILFVIIGSSFGLLGVAAAMALSPMICWPISFWWLSRRASIPVRRLWLGGVKIIIFTLVVGGASALAEQLTAGLPSPWALLVGLAGAAAAYLCVGLLIPTYRRDLGGVLAMVRRNLLSRGRKTTPAP